MENNQFRFKLLWLLLAAVIFSIVIMNWRGLTTWFGLITPFDKAKTVLSLQNINYNNPNDIKTFKVVVPGDEQVTTIALNFKINSMKDPVVLFQTAPDNSGIKFNINPDETMALNLIQQNRQGIVTVPLWQKVTLNEWHTLKIIVWKYHAIKVFYDGALSNSQVNFQSDYNISEIQIGPSLAGTNFDGKVTDFAITSKAIDLTHRQHVNKIAKVVLTFFACLALVAFILLGRQEMDKTYKIAFLSFFILIGFFAAVVFHYILYLYLGETYPRNTFLLYVLGGQFGDFYISLLQSAALSPYTFQLYPGEYPPFIYVLLYPITKLNAHLALILYSVLFTIALLTYVKFYFTQNSLSISDKLVAYKHVLIISLLTYPYLFCLERGNLENLMFILIAAGLCFYQYKRYVMAVIFISLASAIKFYPLMFILLFLSDKRYWEAAGTLILTALLTIVSIFILAAPWRQNLAPFFTQQQLSNICAIGPFNCIHFNASLWGMIKYAKLMNFDIIYTLPQLMHFYQNASFIVLGLVAILVIFVEKIFWRKIALITLAILIFPVLSNHYKLIYLFLPLAAFVNAKPAKFDLFYLSLFVLLLIPKNYYWLEGDVRFSDFLTTGLLLGVFLSLIVQSMSCLYKRELTDESK